MGLTKPRTSVNKQRIVCFGRRFRYCKGCGVSVFVASTHYEIVKVKFRIEDFLLIKSSFWRSDLDGIILFFLFVICVGILQDHPIFIVKNCFKSILKICEIPVFYCRNYKILTFVRIYFYVHYIQAAVYLSYF